MDLLLLGRSLCFRMMLRSSSLCEKNGASIRAGSAGFFRWIADKLRTRAEEADCSRAVNLRTVRSFSIPPQVSSRSSGGGPSPTPRLTYRSAVPEWR